MASIKPAFDERGVKIAGLSTDLGGPTIPANRPGWLISRSYRE